MTPAEQGTVVTYLQGAKSYLDYIRNLKSLEDEPFMPDIADMIGKLDRALTAVRAGFYTRNPDPPLPSPIGAVASPTPSNNGRSRAYQLTPDSHPIQSSFMCIKCKATLEVGEWITHHQDGTYEDTYDTWHFPDCRQAGGSK